MQSHLVWGPGTVDQAISACETQGGYVVRWSPESVQVLAGGEWLDGENIMSDIMRLCF